MLKLIRVPHLFFSFCLLLSAPFAAQQTLIDDLNDLNNANEFENYWYYRDDNRGVKYDDRPQSGIGTKPSIINVPFVEKRREAFGQPSDTFRIKEYQFSCGVENGGNGFATMPFTYGDKWAASWCMINKPCAFPFVEMGTMLAAHGSSVDLTGAAGIRFKIRSHVNNMMVWLKVETADIEADSTEAFYQYAVECEPNGWTEISAYFTDFTQPAWSKPDRVADFNLNKVTNISWCVSKEDNTVAMIDTIDVDDVVLLGTAAAPGTDVWKATELMRPTTGQFSTFENAPRNVTPLGTYWYAFTDKFVGGTSVINQGAAPDVASGLYSLKLDDTESGADKSFGAYLVATTGDHVQTSCWEDPEDHPGFVGIAFNTFDSAKAIYWNTVKGSFGSQNLNPVNSIYFEYNCDGDFSYITLEVLDRNDVVDAKEPLRQPARYGHCFYRKLPVTHGDWRKVCIPLDSLVTDRDGGTSSEVPLDLSTLARVQFKVYGKNSASGFCAIDNVYFPDIKPLVNRASSVQRTSLRNQFSAQVRDHTIQLRITDAVDRRASLITLISTSGAVVYRTTATASAAPMIVPVPRVPAGQYIVQFNGTSIGGGSVILRAPVIITK